MIYLFLFLGSCAGVSIFIVMSLYFFSGNVFCCMQAEFDLATVQFLHNACTVVCEGASQDQG